VELIPHPPKQNPGGSKLPDHLRRERILLKPEMGVRGLRIMGDEVTEILDYTPGELSVKQYIRHKYAAPLGAGLGTVITASFPERIMEKCMAGKGLLAQMVVYKYCDHLPIHRQLQRFARMGVNIVQSTSNDWMRMTLNHLHGLYEVHKKEDAGYWLLKC
jgi:transposase